jgi:hypothetical protein
MNLPSRRSLLIIAVFGSLSTISTAQSYPEVEMVLVPFISQTPGAFGTVWRNELLIGNPLDRDVFVVQGGPCQLAALCYEAEHLEPRSVERIADDRALDNPSTVFFVEKGFARQLSWLLRTRDTSSDPERFGTQVPVAVQTHFRSEPVELIGVVSTPRYRQNLWVWDPDATNVGRVRVIVLDETTNEVIGSAELALLQGSARTLEPISFTQRPSIGQLFGVSSKFPGAISRERVKIRIEPLSPASLRFWAAVFIVDNETQEVSVIAPN